MLMNEALLNLSFARRSQPHRHVFSKPVWKVQ
jgi:hypothetical protein